NSELKSNRIMSLFFQNNRVWIGHQGAGVQIFENDHFRTVPILHDQTIWKIASNDPNHIWLATRNSGLYEFNIKTKAIRNWNAGNSTLKTNNIRTIDFNENGTLIFIGTDDNGVYILDTKINVIKPIAGLGDPVKSLLYHKNTLYVGTNGRSIKVWDITSQKIKNITVKEGLPNEVIYGILMDENEHLWISSNRGISKIVLSDSNPKVTNYSNYEGLQSFEFNTGAYTKAPDGTLFFGGLEGLNWFKPSEIPQNTSKPKTVISKIDLFNNVVNEDRSVFNYDENTLTFTFSSLQFSQPELNQYKYQLVPHDPDWIGSGNSNSAHYTNLAPGNYTFLVKSSNYDGIWNDHVASFVFQIKYPWYKTSFAYIIYSTLLILFLFGIYSYFKFKWKLETQVRLKQAESNRLQQLDDFMI
ncbi:hybrid sensor histidine kinase/response regulator, partial [Marivirga lumbricoides]